MSKKVWTKAWELTECLQHHSLKCDRCHETFEVGNWVRYNSDSGEFVHDDCAPEVVDYDKHS